MSDDFYRSSGSIMDMIEKEQREKKKAVELGKKKPEKLSYPHVLKHCPECDASAVYREIGGYPVAHDAKRGAPDSEGIVTVTCRVCEHIWYEDDMVKKIVVDTKIS